MATRPYSIILMMSDVKPIGGAETFLHLLAARLDRSVFSTRVVVPRTGPMVDRLREADVPVDLIPLARARDITRFPGFLGLLRAHDVQLINAHGVRAGFFAGLARARSPVRVVVSEHNLQDWRRHRVLRTIDRVIARYNDVRTGVSRAIVEDMIASGVCPPEKAQVLHEGIETSRYRTDAAGRARARERFRIAPDELAIVTAGRLAPMKGFIDLIDAVPAIIARLPRVRVIIAGEGAERANLQRRIDELGMAGVVKLPGFEADIPALLAAADVFVLPSVELPGSPREGLPFTIMEALAAGCPVVTTTVSGNAEIVADGVNGRLVAPRDPRALGDAVVAVLSDPDRRRMGENGRRTVEERFSIEYSVKRHSDLFVRLIESPRR